MSIKVMTLVWDRYQGSGSELLAMLALANWCNDDGGSLYPSIKQIALKMRVSRSQAQRVLHGLMPETDKALADGDWFVRVIGNEKGGAPGTTRQYQLNVKRLLSFPEIGSDTGRVDATGSTDATGRMDAQDGSHPCDGTGSMGATQSVIEPSINRQSAHEARKPSSFSKNWKKGTRNGNPQKPINEPLDALNELMGLEN